MIKIAFEDFIKEFEVFKKGVNSKKINIDEALYVVSSHFIYNLKTIDMILERISLTPEQIKQFEKIKIEVMDFQEHLIEEQEQLETQV